MYIMKKSHFFYLLSIISLITGCANNVPQPQQIAQPEIDIIEEIIEPTVDVNTFIKNRLLEQYDEWKGTPYKYNGMNQKGIDCSGLMYLTFKEQFGIELPRSTDLQVQVGETVAKADLRNGDLVFFKTTPRTRHVGVYIGNSKFMHASSRYGVKISNLDNRYWKRTYWTSKRVIS
jgi:cell wall-associated NlpC family hydrolase